MQSKQSTLAKQSLQKKPTRLMRLMRFLVGIFCAFLVLILSGHALTTTALAPPTLLISGGFLTGLFVVIVITKMQIPRNRNWRSFNLAVILIVASLVASLVNSSGSLMGSLAMPVLIALAYFLSEVVTFETFLAWFTTCIAVLAVIAIIVDFLFVTLGVPLWGNQVTNINGATYANGLVVFLLIGWDGSPIDRAMGPFWEPGLFASFLVIALILEISYRPGPVRKWVVVSLTWGIIVSSSTAGYLLLVPALALFLFKRRTAMAELFAVLTSILLLFAFSRLDKILNWLISINPILFGKLEQDVLVSSTRYNIFALNLSLFKESPFIGHGFAGANSEVISRMSEWGVVAQTSTSTYFMAALGLFGLLYTVGWLSIFLDRKLSVSERIIIVVCFLIILNKEPHTTILATTTILFYFVSRSRIERKVS